MAARALNMLTDAVRWGEVEIAYRYGFSRSRTLAITVRPDLSVDVTAPDGTPIEAIRAKVHKRAAWISKARRDFEHFHPLQPPRQYVPGETHRYLGRQHRLRVVQGPTPGVALKRGYLEVTLPGPPTGAVVRPLVEAWMRDRAGEVLRERLTACHKHGALEGVPMPGLTIRPMSVRWGSCSKTGRIVLNVELVKAPKDCIDYVITHELCHLVEHNHGPRFWRLLETVMPDWAERRGRLNRLADV